jgi:hypothetical protein
MNFFFFNSYGIQKYNCWKDKNLPIIFEKNVNRTVPFLKVMINSLLGAEAWPLAAGSIEIKSWRKIE